VALLGLEPGRCGLWIVPKQVLWEHAKRQMLGVSGSGSKWLWFEACKPPEWLGHWGGSFVDARNAVHEVARHHVLRECHAMEQEWWRELAAEVVWPWQTGED
jgi:hypothetical protein